MNCQLNGIAKDNVSKIIGSDFGTDLETQLDLQMEALIIPEEIFGFGMTTVGYFLLRLISSTQKSSKCDFNELRMG